MITLVSIYTALHNSVILCIQLCHLSMPLLASLTIILTFLTTSITSVWTICFLSLTHPYILCITATHVNLFFVIMDLHPNSPIIFLHAIQLINIIIRWLPLPLLPLRGSKQIIQFIFIVIVLRFLIIDRLVRWGGIWWLRWCECCGWTSSRYPWAENCRKRKGGKSTFSSGSIPLSVWQRRGVKHTAWLPNEALVRRLLLSFWSTGEFYHKDDI